MSLYDAIGSVVCNGSYGTIVLDHLAADGTGLLAGQIAVVAVLQVNADLPWCSFSILKRTFPRWKEGLTPGGFREMANRFCVQFTDEFVMDSNALCKGRAPMCGLYIAVRQLLGADLDAVHKGDKRLSVKGLNVCALPGQIKESAELLSGFVHVAWSSQRN